MREADRPSLGVMLMPGFGAFAPLGDAITMASGLCIVQRERMHTSQTV